VRCLVIGDRHHEVRAALGTGVRAVGVTWGYETPEELRETGAREHCAHPSTVALIEV